MTEPKCRSCSREEPARARRQLRWTGRSDQGEAARAITEYHKETDDLDSVLLPAVSSDNPMTYMHEGRQYVLIAVGGGGQPAEIVAFALPAGE